MQSFERMDGRQRNSITPDAVALLTLSLDVDSSSGNNLTSRSATLLWWVFFV